MSKCAYYCPQFCGNNREWQNWEACDGSRNCRKLIVSPPPCHLSSDERKYIFSGKSNYANPHPCSICLRLATCRAKLNIMLLGKMRTQLSTHNCANSIMQKLIVFALLVPFSAQWETEIPSAIFSSAEKQAAWNYNLEIWHKFYGEKYPNEKWIFKEWIFWELLRINWIWFLRIRWRPFGVPAPPLSPWVNNPPNPEFDAAPNSNSKLSLSLLNGNTI